MTYRTTKFDYQIRIDFRPVGKRLDARLVGNRIEKSFRRIRIGPQERFRSFRKATRVPRVRVISYFIKVVITQGPKKKNKKNIFNALNNISFLLLILLFKKNEFVQNIG